MIVFIYTLKDPITGRARYIGKAKDPYDRYVGHLRDCDREETPKTNWIRSLQALNQSPILEVLDEVSVAEWQFWEKEWIRLYRALGFDLTNANDGGSGGANPSAATREKIGASHRGKCISQKHREKISAAHTGKYVSLDTREKLRAAQLRRPKSPAVIAAIIAAVIAANTGSKRTPEVLEKMRGAQQRRRARERGSLC